MNKIRDLIVILIGYCICFLLNDDELEFNV